MAGSAEEKVKQEAGKQSTTGPSKQTKVNSVLQYLTFLLFLSVFLSVTADIPLQYAYIISASFLIFIFHYTANILYPA